MGDAGFQDHVRFDAIDHFLHADDVFRVLDDRPSEPTEGIWIFLIPANLQPVI